MASSSSSIWPLPMASIDAANDSANFLKKSHCFRWSVFPGRRRNFPLRRTTLPALAWPAPSRTRKTGVNGPRGPRNRNEILDEWQHGDGVRGDRNPNGSAAVRFLQRESCRELKVNASKQVSRNPMRVEPNEGGSLG